MSAAPRRPNHRVGNATPPIPPPTPHVSSELQVHESVRGAGQVADGARLLGEVDYKLKDVEEVQRAVGAPGFFPGGEAGVRTVYGVIIARVSGVLDAYVGARLVLRLDDARLLDFTVAKVMEPKMYLIRGLGRFR